MRGTRQKVQPAGCGDKIRFPLASHEYGFGGHGNSFSIGYRCDGTQVVSINLSGSASPSADSPEAALCASLTIPEFYDELIGIVRRHHKRRIRG